MTPIDLPNDRDAWLIMVCVVLTGAARAAWPSAFSGRVGRRLLPLVPLAIGALVGGLGAIQADSPSERWLRGVVLGALAAHAFKATRTSLLGIGLGQHGTQPTLRILPKAKLKGGRL